MAWKPSSFALGLLSTLASAQSARVVTVVVRQSCGVAVGFPSTLDYGTNPASFGTLPTQTDSETAYTSLRVSTAVSISTAATTIVSEGVTSVSSYPVTITPPPVSYVTVTNLYSGSEFVSQPITTTIGNTVIVQIPQYTVSYGDYTETAVLTGPSTISTVFPSGNVPGTYIIALPQRYVTVTTYYTGTVPITEPITSTIGPSGTRSGTVVIQTPPAYTTTTTRLGTLSSISIPVTSTYAASGSDAWTVIVETPAAYTAASYITTTQLYTGAPSISGAITYETTSPYGTNSGTVLTETPPAYSAPVSQLSSFPVTMPSDIPISTPSIVQTSSGVMSSSEMLPPIYSTEVSTSNPATSTGRPAVPYGSLAKCPAIICGPTANNATLCESPYGNAFNVTCGIKVYGTIRKRAAAENVTSCLTQCDAEPGCVAINFLASPGPESGNCELYSNVEGYTQEPGVATAERPADAPPVYTVPLAASSTTAPFTNSEGQPLSTTSADQQVTTTTFSMLESSTPASSSSSLIDPSSVDPPVYSPPAPISTPSSVAPPASSPPASIGTLSSVPPPAYSSPELADPTILSSLTLFSTTETTTTASASPSAVPSGVCPDSDGTTATSPNGIQYLLACGRDTTGVDASTTQYQTVNSYAECYDGCDALGSGCQGFTWAGLGSSVNGVGEGSCYLKTIGPDGAPLGFSGNGDRTKISAIKIVANADSSTLSTASLTSTVIPLSSSEVVSPTSLIPIISTSSSSSSPPSATGLPPVYSAPDPVPIFSSSDPLSFTTSSSSGSSTLFFSTTIIPTSSISSVPPLASEVPPVYSAPDPVATPSNSVTLSSTPLFSPTPSPTTSSTSSTLFFSTTIPSPPASEPPPVYSVPDPVISSSSSSSTLFFTTTITTITTSSISSSSSTFVSVPAPPPVYPDPDSVTTTTVTTTTPFPTTTTTMTPFPTTTTTTTSFPITTTTTTTTSSTYSTSASPTAVGDINPNTCPAAANRGDTYANSAGFLYSVYCQAGYSGDLGLVPDQLTLDSCTRQCDIRAGCGAVEYQGTNCYLKRPQALDNDITFPGNNIVAIKVVGQGVPPTRTTTTTTVTPSIYVTSTSGYQIMGSTSAIYTARSIAPSGTVSGTIVIASPLATAPCINQGYLTQQQTLYQVDILSGNFTQTTTWKLPTVDAAGARYDPALSINSLGYNPIDSYLYGTIRGRFPESLCRLGNDGTVQEFLSLGNTGVTRAQGGRFYIADIDTDGQYYAGSQTQPIDGNLDWIQVNLNPALPNYGQIVASGRTTTGTTQYLLQDWAFVPGGGNALYSVIISSIEEYNTPNSRTISALMKFDLATKQLSRVGTFTAGQNGNGQFWNLTGTATVTWNGLYSDTAGNLYGSEGITGQVWKFSIAAPLTAVLISQGPVSSLADGARCVLNGTIV